MLQCCIPKCNNIDLEWNRQTMMIGNNQFDRHPVHIGYTIILNIDIHDSMNMKTLKVCGTKFHMAFIIGTTYSP